MVEIDEIDQKIIDLIKEDCKLSTRKIAKKTLIPITTVYTRIKRLEQAGVIKKYAAIIDENRLGRTLIVYIFLQYNSSIFGQEVTKEEQKKRLRFELKKKILSLPNIQEVTYIAGDYDIFLKARLKDMGELNDLIVQKIRNIPGISKTKTIFVLEEVK